MNKKWLAVMAVLVLISAWAIQRLNSKTPLKERPAISQLEAYWTCPMHPQIHAEHAGECPICHMKLIQVKATNEAQIVEQGDKRVAVSASGSQIALLGIQRTEVEKMNLKLKIPVSGRFISSSAVAFQIYESDLRYIKAGLTFHGANSFYPEEEVVGVISSVDSIVDPTSRTVRVVGSVQKGARGALSETGFRGDIEFELKDRVAIPESSVLHTGEEDIVYVFAKGNQLKPTIVKLGLKSEGFFDVMSGVSPGEEISSGPNFLIDSESKIRGASTSADGSKPSTPACADGEHWDIPMSMCMPGKSL
jgi:hypothetical protein